jgi:DNA-binding transcriptional LysR family regulator
MDMNRVRYFCTIAQAGSLVKAAQTLGISSAALSKSVRLLEEELGLDLILPAGRGIIISQEGLRFARKGQELLLEVDKLAAFAAGTLKHNNLLRIGSFEVFTTYLMGEIYQELEGSYELTVHELIPGKIEEALLDGRIDMGLTYQPILHSELDHLPIGKVKMCVFGLKKNFADRTLEELPFAVPVEPLYGVPSKAQGLDGWLPDFGPRQISFKVTLMETALELARRGFAVAYLPSFVVDIHNSYVTAEHKLTEVYRLPRGQKTSPVYLVKRKGEVESAGMKKVARVLRRKLF